MSSIGPKPISAPPAAAAYALQTSRKFLREAAPFLTGASALGGAPIDYALEAHQTPHAGFYGAFVSALACRSFRAPPTTQQVLGWHAMIVNEMQEAEAGPHTINPGVANRPLVLEGLVEELRGALGGLGAEPGPADVLGIMSEVAYQLLREQPFAGANPQMTLLLMNFIGAFADLPPLAIGPRDHHALREASSSPKKLFAFFLERSKAAIYDRAGDLLVMTEDLGTSARYRGRNGREITMEWHEAYNALDEL